MSYSISIRATFYFSFTTFCFIILFPFTMLCILFTIIGNLNDFILDATFCTSQRLSSLIYLSPTTLSLGNSPIRNPLPLSLVSSDFIYPLWHSLSTQFPSSKPTISIRSQTLTSCRWSPIVTPVGIISLSLSVFRSLSISALSETHFFQSFLALSLSAIGI